MAYTVKELAEISGVSVQTLHWYDEVALLKPAYHGSNGYRYYEEEQLLILQQILFFKKLGFALKEIRKVLGRSDFDILVALSTHRQVLKKNLEQTRELIKTIDKTMEHLRGTKKMKEKEDNTMPIELSSSNSTRGTPRSEPSSGTTPSEPPLSLASKAWLTSVVVSLVALVAALVFVILHLSNVNFHSVDTGKLAGYTFGAWFGIGALGLVMAGPMYLFSRWVELNISRLV